MKNKNYLFPNKPLSKKEVLNQLAQRMDELPNYKGKDGIYRFGFAMTEPHPITIEVQNSFLPYNTTNVGIHTIDTGILKGTKLLEQQCMGMLSDLLNGIDLDGYITSGGTEGNIMGTWIGRNLLQQKGSKKITMLTSSLSHQSFQKSSNLLEVSNINLSLDENFGIDIPLLIKIIKDLLEKGEYDGFILCLTAGYYSTGSSDNISGICAELSKLPKSILEKIYIHVDACFGGFVFPFSKPSFQFDFRNKLVSSMSVDPHKMGLMPYSCGLFFSRKSLIKVVETVNKQAKVIDRTLVGSRPGATAASLWALLNTLGKTGYQKIIRACMQNKKYFMKKLRKLDPNIIILEWDYSNNFAVSFNFINKGLLPAELEQHYRIVPNTLIYKRELNSESRNFYHFYMMPYITKTAINAFLAALIKLKDHEQKRT